MCVIIVCPKGVSAPSIEMLDAARKSNPHGFGFVSDSKFYKTVDFFLFLKELAKVDINENLIIHFRYATHGSVKRSNCHPFKCRDLYFAHNGVLSVMPDNDMTDSETAFRNEIYPAFKKYGYYSQRFDEICKQVAGNSKFAFLYKGSLKLIGDYIYRGGRYFSNMRFMVDLLD